MKLSDYSQGRDNNFNLIRMIAALAVLVTHSFALVYGSGDAEPFHDSLGMTIGGIAVDVFFITSGFLVTASLLYRQSTIEFIWARVLRVFPALLVMLLLTVFVLGTFFTTLTLLNYLSTQATYAYLFKCSTLLFGVAYDLPGVFQDNPYPNAVNGSLWTMPHEIRMYAILVLIWFGLRITQKFHLSVFKIIILTLTVIAGLFWVARHFYFDSAFARLFFMFFAGASFYILRERIVISRWIFWFLLGSLVLAAIHPRVFSVVYVFAITYILFYVAYVPSGFIRKYNQLGDYSYGIYIYIYAFPIQQSVAALVPGVSVIQMILISAVVTIVLAALSWHFLEQRALSLKAHYIGQSKKLLAYKRSGIR